MPDTSTHSSTKRESLFYHLTLGQTLSILFYGRWSQLTPVTAETLRNALWQIGTRHVGKLPNDPQAKDPAVPFTNEIPPPVQRRQAR
jgi:hypothetical protein